MRKEQSAQLLTALEAWLREQRARLSNSSSVAKPIDYMLRRWDLISNGWATVFARATVFTPRSRSQPSHEVLSQHVPRIRAASRDEQPRQGVQQTQLAAAPIRRGLAFLQAGWPIGIARQAIGRANWSSLVSGLYRGHRHPRCDQARRRPITLEVSPAGRCSRNVSTWSAHHWASGTRCRQYVALL